MKSTIVIATICAMLINFSDAELKLTNQDILGFGPLVEDAIDVCGYSMEISNYSVKGVSLDSPKIGGCAYTDYKKNGMEVEKSFNVWLSNLQSDKQQCGEVGMEHIIFSCMGMPMFIESNNYRTQYVRLYGRVTDNKGADSSRCALLEKEIGGNKKYRLVVSGDNLCTGLPNYFTDTYPRIQTGSKLLRFFGEPKYQLRFKRDLWTTMDIAASTKITMASMNGNSFVLNHSVKVFKSVKAVIVLDLEHKITTHNACSRNCCPNLFKHQYV